MPVTPAPHPDLQENLSKVLRLKAENAELQRINRSLTATIQRLEASLETQPDEIVKLKEDNEGLVKQLEEIVKQMIEAEEKVISAETKAQEYNKRTESVASSRDRIVAQKDETIAELREQNILLQEYMITARNERDAALQKVKQLDDEVADLRASLEQAKQRESDILRESLGDVEVLCGKMEEQIQKEVSLKRQKEDECTALATELEEARAEADEMHDDLVRCKRLLDEAAQERLLKETLLTSLRGEADGLRRDLKEKGVAMVILQEEVDVCRVELKMLKEKSEHETALQAEMRSLPQAHAQTRASKQAEHQAQAQAKAQSQAQAEEAHMQAPFLMTAQVQGAQRQTTSQTVQAPSESPKPHIPQNDYALPPRQTSSNDYQAYSRHTSPRLASHSASSAASKPVSTRDIKELEREMEEITKRWTAQAHTAHCQPDASAAPGAKVPMPTLAYLKQRYMS